jgi:DNA-binding NarL/FixJ family response regulator
VDAKAALAEFEALGSSRLADAAAALLRSLGDRSRVGAKDVGELTNRESEILLLLAQGLTNAEIAGRLYISTKTAGNHVSAILAKLGVRSRTEAAAYAAMHTSPNPSVAGAR